MKENRRSFFLRGLKALAVAVPAVAVVAGSAKPTEAGLLRRRSRRSSGCSTGGCTTTTGCSTCR